jgi:hypothetical protein
MKLKLIYWMLLLAILAGCTMMADSNYREIDIQCADGTTIYSQWGQESESKEVTKP